MKELGKITIMGTTGGLNNTTKGFYEQLKNSVPVSPYTVPKYTRAMLEDAFLGMWGQPVGLSGKLILLSSQNHLKTIKRFVKIWETQNQHTGSLKRNGFL